MGVAAEGGCCIGSGARDGPAEHALWRAQGSHGGQGSRSHLGWSSEGLETLLQGRGLVCSEVPGDQADLQAHWHCQASGNELVAGGVRYGGRRHQVPSEACAEPFGAEKHAERGGDHEPVLQLQEVHQ